jgi:hypothetical protein
MNLKYIKQPLTTALFSLLFFVIGCKKFIEVEAPVTSVNSANVYTNDNTAIAVLTGMYEKMFPGSRGNSTIAAMSLFPELSSDNLVLGVPVNLENVPYYQNNLNATNSNPSIFWQFSYQQIFVANSAIEGLTASNSLTPLVKQRLLGEAKFMRAFYFFYLTNLYGDVPLTTSTDYKVNAVMGRTPITTVYQQIVTDLKEAQSSLSDEYLDITFSHPSLERIRPNKMAATALLARVYLYTKDYIHAESEASTLIDNSPQLSLSAIGQVFLNRYKTILIPGKATYFNCQLQGPRMISPFIYRVRSLVILTIWIYG